MPIMLTQTTARRWLDGDQDVLSYQRPNLDYYPVFQAVNDTNNDGPELIEPIQLAQASLF